MAKKETTEEIPAEKLDEVTAWCDKYFPKTESDPRGSQTIPFETLMLKLRPGPWKQVYELFKDVRDKLPAGAKLGGILPRDHEKSDRYMLVMALRFIPSVILAVKHAGANPATIEHLNRFLLEPKVPRDMNDGDAVLRDLLIRPFDKFELYSRTGEPNYKGLNRLGITCNTFFKRVSDMRAERVGDRLVITNIGGFTWSETPAFPFAPFDGTDTPADPIKPHVSRSVRAVAEEPPLPETQTRVEDMVTDPPVRVRYVTFDVGLTLEESGLVRTARENTVGAASVSLPASDVRSLMAADPTGQTLLRAIQEQAEQDRVSGNFDDVEMELGAYVADEEPDAASSVVSAVTRVNGRAGNLTADLISQATAGLDRL